VIIVVSSINATHRMIDGSVRKTFTQAAVKANRERRSGEYLQTKHPLKHPMCAATPSTCEGSHYAALLCPAMKHFQELAR